MKKEKKSSHSKPLERRHHKISKSHHGKESNARERHEKHQRSRSPSSSKRKHEDKKEHETSKSAATEETSTDKMELSHSTEETQGVTSLGSYINDRPKMIREIFNTVPQETVTKLTGSSLKNCSLEELKAMCLEELNRMSQAEIIHILSGKDPALLDSTKDSGEIKKQDIVVWPTEDNEESLKSGTTANLMDVPNVPPSEKSKAIAARRMMRPGDDRESTPSIVGDAKSETESDSLELCATQKEIDSLIQEEIMNQTGARGIAQQSNSDLTDMEILELELRARIIRSLLKSQGMEVSDDEAIQQKENVGIKPENT